MGLASPMKTLSPPFHFKFFSLGPSLGLLIKHSLSVCSLC
jgi:hypothetical protein